jgi:hypothetical protein
MSEDNSSAVINEYGSMANLSNKHHEVKKVKINDVSKLMSMS